GRQVLGLQIAERWDPTIRETACEAKHPRPVSAEPDAHVVRGLRPRVDAGQLIEAPVELEVALAAPHAARDLDRFLHGRHRLARRAHRPSHGFDRLPETAGAEPKLEPAATEHVD